MLVVYADQVYQVVPGDGNATVTLPEPTLIDEPEQTTTIGGETAVPTKPDALIPPANSPDGAATSFNWVLFGVSFVLGLAVIVLLVNTLVGKRP